MKKRQSLKRVCSSHGNEKNSMYAAHIIIRSIILIVILLFTLFLLLCGVELLLRVIGLQEDLRMQIEITLIMLGLLLLIAVIAFWGIRAWQRKCYQAGRSTRDYMNKRMGGSSHEE